MIDITVGQCTPVGRGAVDMANFKVDLSQATTRELLDCGVIQLLPGFRVIILGKENEQATNDLRAALAASYQLGQDELEDGS